MALSVEYMIAHGAHRTMALERELDAFLQSDFWSQSREEDVDRVKIYFSVDRDLPDPLHGMFFDATMALRAALDHLAYAFCDASNAAGLTEVKMENLYFPIADTEAKVRQRAESSKLHPAFCEVVLRSKPYKEGNHDLWALHRLANHQKHRMVQLMLCGIESFRLQGNIPRSADPESRPGRLQFPSDLRVGTSLVADLPNRAGVSGSVSFTPFVGMYVPGVLEPRPVIDFLTKVRRDVQVVYNEASELVRNLGLA